MTVDATNNPRWGKMPELHGAWFGDALPGMKAIEFCAPLFGAEHRVTGITFSPSGDEAFFSLNTPSRDSADLMWTRVVNNVWTAPEPASFNSAQIDNDICMSPDGQRLCWRSWRALPGNHEPERHVSLWAVDRISGGWGDPFPVECGGERQAAVYPGIAANGTIYFSVRTSPGEYCIARARRDGTQYRAKEIIIPGLTSAADLCVAPDESFLVATIFRLPGFKGQADLQVSFQAPDGTWSALMDIGSAVKSDLTEFCPTISADGRWLFFCRIDREDSEVPARAFWVSSEAILNVRSRAISAGTITNEEGC